MEQIIFNLDEIVKIEKITDDAIYFSNKGKLMHSYTQDCCEYNYADFESLNDTTIFDEYFDKLVFEVIEGIGFRLNGYLVNCYSIQNGYYSSWVDISYKEKDCEHYIFGLSAQKDEED